MSPSVSKPGASLAPQKGAALFVSLALLLALSILGIAAARSGLLQNLMSANTTQATVEIEAATSALGVFMQLGNDVNGRAFLGAVTAAPVIAANKASTELLNYSTDSWFRSIDQYGAIQNVPPGLRLDGEAGRKAGLITSLSVAYFPEQPLLPPTALCPAGFELNRGAGGGGGMKCHTFRVSGLARVDGAGAGRRVVGVMAYFGPASP